MRFTSGEVMPGLFETETYVEKNNMLKKIVKYCPFKGNQNRVAECYSSHISGFFTNEQ